MRFIVNPVAGGGRVAKSWPKLRELLEAELPGMSWVQSEYPGHAVELAREALQEGHETLVAVGGDGTVHEVANGIMEESGGSSEVRLGLFPLGTGSDIRRTLGLPRDHRALCQILKRGKTSAMDLGELHYHQGGEEKRRYFVNFAGLGFDGEIVERLAGKPKAGQGTIPYLMALFAVLARYQNKELSLWIDGEEHKMRASSVIVCNGRYAAGGMFVAPPALLDDGLFDTVVFGDLSKLEVIYNVPRIYRGTHLTHPKVKLYPAREVRVETEERMVIQADGELIGLAPVSFRILPQALRIIC